MEMPKVTELNTWITLSNIAVVIILALMLWGKGIPTKEALEKAEKEAIERHPGQPVYILVDFEDYYERIIPDQYGGCTTRG